MVSGADSNSNTILWYPAANSGQCVPKHRALLMVTFHNFFMYTSKTHLASQKLQPLHTTPVPPTLTPPHKPSNHSTRLLPPSHRSRSTPLVPTLPAPPHAPPLPTPQPQTHLCIASSRSGPHESRPKTPGRRGTLPAAYSLPGTALTVCARLHRLQRY